MSGQITEAFLHLAHALRVSGFDPEDFAVSVHSKKSWEFVSVVAREINSSTYPSVGAPAQLLGIRILEESRPLSNDELLAMLKERMK